jgi:hypothetical protein
VEVPFFEDASGVMESAELDGHTSADADEGGERAFVEGEGTFVLEDRGGA